MAWPCLCCSHSVAGVRYNRKINVYDSFHPHETERWAMEILRHVMLTAYPQEGDMKWTLVLPAEVLPADAPVARLMGTDVKQYEEEEDAATWKEVRCWEVDNLMGGGGAWPGQRVEEQGTWAAQKHSEAGDGRPVDRGAWTAKTVKRPRQQPAHPQYANYWAPLTRKRHILPHPAQPQHANYWAPRTRTRHQQEHRPQRPTESSNPTQHAKGRTGDRPGPRKGATTRRNVTRGGGGVASQSNPGAVPGSLVCSLAAFPAILLLGLAPSIALQICAALVCTSAHGH